MKLRELNALLHQYPSAFPRFILPDGDRIPAHYHITEVGHVINRFIDCGGLLHDRTEVCLLQTWVGDDEEHRLDAATLGKILTLGQKVLAHDDLPVEVEYDCCVVSQYPITNAEISDSHLFLHLGAKHTDCLAKRRRERAKTEGREIAAACCC